jgi:hypothetical protein
MALAKAIAALSASFKNGLNLILSVMGVSIKPGHIVIIFIPYFLEANTQEIWNKNNNYMSWFY